MFRKILIANRGEIALRVIRACRELGIKTVAVHSQADSESLHVRFADEAVCIGPADSKSSYLNIPSIISAAEITDAEAIHPGYGFLSENAHFAEICDSCQIKFIGPTAETIRTMGNKSQARQTMIQAKVPTLPGSEALSDPEEAKRFAHEIGYPVIIKAVAGGGGKGMRVVHTDASFLNAFMTAQAEAAAAFNSSEVYIEKYLEEPKHIEVQVLGDQHGNAVYLGERECSIQRRYQKLIEESPSPVITPESREKIGKVASNAVKALNYWGAGTLEFLYDKGNFYFMEMNTRIQVEHPVTEMVTGIDLIKEQIRIASGEPLGYGQKDIKMNGHSIECRINAEDPVSFLPQPGRITEFNVPGGPWVRVDTAVYNNYTVLPYYDSMIAKLIVWGHDRQEAICRMRRALGEFVIQGVKTTIPFHNRVFNNATFLKGNFSTRFVENFLSSNK
ncbi:MAG: acetyl-CoA carboxylase biotin carboxylase subunit [Candidatus Schekmanbacteria bacterium]|nr:acetyl-CoA carboxylase biotin carboxylase subunit [Candidatus Schekmanbacteria bacterium]